MLAAANMADSVTLKIASTAQQVSLLSEALHALCLYATGNEKCALDVQCATVEALNNVVIHAYHNQPGHEITVCWYRQDRQLRIEIIDNGDSMAALPEPVLPDFEAEGGRGWWIINASVDSYFYKIIEGVERERVLFPGENHESVATAKPNAHRNILTLLKQF